MKNGSRRSRAFAISRRRLATGLTVIFFALLSVTAFFFAQQAEQQEIRARFNARAQNLAATLHKSIEGDLEVLRSIGALFATEFQVSRNDFHLFTQDTLLRRKDIRALSWDLRILDAQRLEFELATQKEGFPNFQITERLPSGELTRARQRPEYVVVYFRESPPGSEFVLGYDLASEPVRREALERARDTGTLTATGQIKLLTEPGNQNGILVLQPTYRYGEPRETLAQRRENLEGFAVAAFRIGDMIDAALEGSDRAGIDLSLIDHSAKGDERWLFGRSDLDASDISLSSRVEIGGREWIFVFALMPEYLETQRSLASWIIFAVGMLIAGLFGTLVYSYVGRAAQVEQFVEARTSELENEIRQRQKAEDSAVRQALHAQTFVRVAGQFNSQLNLEAILSELCETSTRVMSADAASVTLYDVEKKEFIFTSEFGMPKDWLKQVRPATFHDYEEYGKPVQPVVIRDVQAVPNFPNLDLYRAQNVHTLVGTIIRTEGVLIGSLSVYFKSLQEPTNDQLEFLQGLADQAAQAIRNARLFQDVKRELDERTRAEQKLRESEERYSALIQQSVEMIYIYDATTMQVVEANPAFFQQLGLALKDIGTLTAYDFVAHEKTEITGWVRQVIADGVVTVGERKWRRKDGSLIDVDVTASAKRFGDRDLVFVVARDITARKRDQAEIERRSREFHELYETTRDLAAQQQLDTLLRAIAERAMNLLDAPIGYVYLYNAAENVLELSVSTGVEIPHTPRIPYGMRVTGTVAAKNEPMIIDDYQTWHDRNPVGAQRGYRAILEVPMYFGGECVGVLGVAEFADSTRKFTKAHSDLLQTFAAQAASAVHSARLLEQTQQRAAHLSALNDLSTAVSTLLDIPSILRAVHHHVQEILSLDTFFIALLDPETKTLSYPIVWDDGKFYQQNSDHLPPQSALARVLETASPLRIARAAEAIAAMQTPHHAVGDSTKASASLLFAPLHAGSKVLGALSVQSYRVNAFTDDDLELLATISEIAGSAIHRAQLFQAEQRALKVAQTVMSANIALNESLNLDTVLNTLLEHLEYLVPYDQATVMLRQEKSGMKIRAVRSPKNLADPETLGRIEFGLEDFPLLRQMADSGKSINIPDTHACPDWNPIEGTDYIRSWLGVPLIAGGLFLGNYSLIKLEPHGFTDADKKIAEALAAQAAVVIQNAKLFEQRRADEITLRRLSRQVVLAQEEERRLVSRELHDEAGQALTALIMNLTAVRSKIPPGSDVHRRIAGAISIAESTLNYLREMARKMRPAALDAISLDAALADYCRNYGGETGLRIDFSSARLPRVPEPIKITLYRVLQEALTNVTRHAATREVCVKLERYGKALILSVQDRGKGFDTAGQLRDSKTLGITSMRERIEILGGTFALDSQIGKGTCVTARVPLKNGDYSAHRRSPT